MNRRHSLPVTISFAALVSGGAFALVQQAKPQGAQSQQAPAHQQDSPPPGMQGFPDLVGGLKQSPGCLGVETARTASGKNVIFAWFENKKAVEAWYDSDMHQQAMKTFFPGEHGRPMANVPDDIGPIMAIASLTMVDRQNFEQTTLPVSQIAIELYTPVTGGLFLGGRFAPESLQVKGIEDYTPERRDTAEE